MHTSGRKRGAWVVSAALALGCVAVACGLAAGSRCRSRVIRRHAFPTRAQKAAVHHDAGVDAFVKHDAGKAPPGLDCAEAGVTYIYVIAENNELYAFHPERSTDPFELIGVIDCPDPGQSPFSMAVDHRGVAYVVFSDGQLFRVSTADASCQATSFVPGQHGVTKFGMGFVANVTEAGLAGETLYVASDVTNELATIDVDTFELKPVGRLGSIDGIQVFMAELTGTGSGGLYGFFAETPGSAPSYIARLNPQNAQVLSGVELPQVEEGNGWAFGFWGGDFFTFTAPGQLGTTLLTTVVTRYRPADSSIVEIAMAPPGVEIVGAGVSTCAPTE